MAYGQQIARWSPAAILLIAAIAMLAHGPIEQFADYHDFADERDWLDIPNAGDVLSNVPFALAGLWGIAAAWHRVAYRLFFVSLVLTAAGSAWYHLSPDDARLVWDRIQIALACAGLLYAVHAETRGAQRPAILPIWIAAAIASVLWWSISDDLRPYIFLQAAPLVVIPLWQWIYGAPGRERIAFGVAILLYIAAKMAELNDAAIFDALGVVSGHTLKHLLAATASAVIVGSLTKSPRAA